jgi:PAS domain S-box-containing protein
MPRPGEILAALGEHSPLAFLQLDAGGRIVWFDEHLQTLLGCRAEGLADRPLMELATPECRADLEEWFKSSKGGETGSMEFRLGGFERPSRPVRLIVIAGGAPGGSDLCLGALIDLSEQERLEKEVREVNHRLRTVYKCIPVSTITWQLQGGDFRLVDYNNVAEDITLGKIQDFLGSTTEEFYHDRPDIIEDLNRCFNERRDIRRQWAYTFRTTGEEAYFIATFAYIAPDMVMIHTQDITKRRRAEQDLYTYQQQLLSLALELSKTEERERRRIAGDLHDGVGQYLALSRLNLSKLKKSVNHEQAVTLDQVIDLISRAIEDTRTLTVELSPPVLYELGLHSALEWLAEISQQRHGIRVHFKSSGRPGHLSEELRGFLYRAAAELLANVAKHSQATETHINLDWNEDTLKLSVTDNGRGFVYPEARSAEPRGFGLFSIRERLRPLRGAWQVVSEPGQGAEVSLTVPITPTEPRPES